MMRGALGVVAAAALFGPAALASRTHARRPRPDRFNFAEVAAGVDETHHVADGYQADILLRWGDPVIARLAGVRSLTPKRRGAIATVRLQQRLSWRTSRSRERRARPAVVNHEYTNEEVMFPRVGRQDLTCFPDMTPSWSISKWRRMASPLSRSARSMAVAGGARQQVQPPHQPAA